MIRGRAGIRVLALAGMVFVAVVALAQAQTPQVTIDDIYNAGRLEYVQVTNRTGAAVPMSGWSIASERGGQRYTFPPGYALAAGATVKVHSGIAPRSAPPTDLVWTNTNVWNNQGDLALLLNAGGGEVWSYQYGAWSSARAARTRR